MSNLEFTDAWDLIMEIEWRIDAYNKVKPDIYGTPERFIWVDFEDLEKWAT